MIDSMCDFLLVCRSGVWDWIYKESYMDRFKKLLLADLVGYILVMICFVVMWAGYSSSTMFYVLITLLVVLMSYTGFLLLYYLYRVRK